ncbi:cysteine peptidase family C39 domain-containing protein [Streptomyces cinerochromogenes]|uniref:Cysteine peptidase family C39 domain-containing protein n=1 Tax=Streptomyces cinerochromogenes TaxID=66422 RepID=A0ABW7B4X5_9ACTN
MHRKPKIPVRLQTDTTDCGPACLSMVLAYHRIQVTVQELREEMAPGSIGVSARTIVATARRHGLPGRGLQVQAQAIQHLPPSSILFWRYQHFVVLEKATRKHINIIDPSIGRRRISHQSASNSFGGIAICFAEPHLKPTAIA